MTSKPNGGTLTKISRSCATKTTAQRQEGPLTSSLPTAMKRASPSARDVKERRGADRPSGPEVGKVHQHGEQRPQCFHSRLKPAAPSPPSRALALDLHVEKELRDDAEHGAPEKHEADLRRDVGPQDELAGGDPDARRDDPGAERCARADAADRAGRGPGRRLGVGHARNYTAVNGEPSGVTTEKRSQRGPTETNQGAPPLGLRSHRSSVVDSAVSGASVKIGFALVAQVYTWQRKGTHMVGARFGAGIVVGLLAGVAVAGETEAGGYLLERDDEVKATQPGPHDGGGETVAYSFFAKAPALKLVFRKRAFKPGAAISYHLQKEDESTTS